MKHICKYHIAGFLIAAFVCFAKTSEASVGFYSSHQSFSASDESTLTNDNSTFQDTSKLRYPLKPEDSFASERKARSSFNLESPSNIIITVEYDPKTKAYTIFERVGKYNIKPPRVMSEEEYRKYQFENSMREYWWRQSAGQSANAGSGLLPRVQVGGETFDRIFGSNTIEIIPQGSADLSFGINSTKTENTYIPVDMRKSTTFDFKSKIQMNVDGKIGEKLKMNVQYNTEATFDFENNVKVEYTGFEDEIIQKIEAGNVALPLQGTLITGSQSLFGFKTQLKFGKLNITSIFSKQNGQTQVIEVKGGAQTKEFSLSADEYEANKHFFLSQYFRDVYNRTLQNLPIVNSGVNISKIEVWVTNTTKTFENSRDAVAFIDLGESQANIYAPLSVCTQTGAGPYPDNGLNSLYSKMTIQYSGIRDIKSVNDVLSLVKVPKFTEGNGYEVLQNARKLNATEFSYNSKLGYISLNSTLSPDEQLAVAYEYTVDGQIYKVGELSTDGITAPSALILKLIMGETHSPKIPPTWKLMMKNIYSLGAYQVSKDGFFLDIFYHNDVTGTDLKYINEGSITNIPLIKVLNLDNLNSQGDVKPDGIFDFLNGAEEGAEVKVPITINSVSGKVIFPVLEPFGKDLASRIGNKAIADKYAYQEIYDSTLTKARLVSRKNKFKLAGTYQSSSSNEISLNAANIPKGSVIVTAGGAKLAEGVDYTVDYNLGSVKIIAPGLIESGTPIKISLENNALFNFQTKTLVGTHFDYQISDKFNVGATILNLTERPLTQKVNFGNEAVSNTIWGLNSSFQTESSFLTKMVDFLPFIQTKEKSTITINAEFAQLIPGYSKAIGRNGTVFIDDFESSTSPIDLLLPQSWKLASAPLDQPDLFPEVSNNKLSSGFKRALISWYIIDPLFLRQESINPSYIRNNEKLRSSHWVREIFEHELYPNKNTPQGQPTNLPILNVAFYPKEKGPYNYNDNSLGVEIDNNGHFINPGNSWGGIMRPISGTDFEAQNINYIEFWLMDPFVYDSSANRGGDLYFDLGNLSEDVLPDNNMSFEGGLPITDKIENTDTTVWGRVPKYSSLPNVFTSNSAKQKYQDVGLDGLSSNYDLDGDGVNDEEKFFEGYINGMTWLNPEAFNRIQKDPSNDDYMYYLDPYYTTVEAGILDRYKKYNNMEGNTPVNEQTTQSGATPLPDGENINSNPKLNTTESYFQYKVSLRHDDMVVGKNYITNKLVYYASMPAYSSKQKVSWYQFKIPIDKYQEFGTPEFTNISMARMFLKNFSDTLILRFAKLQLVRDEWRKYDAPMIEGQEGIPSSDLPTGTFNISAVNFEDNSSRTPINYILPPGLSRTTDPSQSQTVEQNEQSMEMKVVDLADGDARAAYKSLNIDIRKYRKLNMDVHAEAIPGYSLEDDDVTLFLRLGTDNTDNYYEYEVPLKITPAPPKGRYNNNSEADREIVWPRENFLDISLETLTNAKLVRNDAMHKQGSSVTLSTVFVKMDGDRKIRVRGNPSLSNVKVLMVGIRNPGHSSNSNSNGQPKSAIVWVNELRVSSTTNESGWAANAQVSAKLADLGMVTVAGSTSKPGFGSIESKVSERTSEDYYHYDLSASLEMGKFFPVKSGIKIPLYLGYSETFSNPEYNPLDPDIPLRTALKNASSKYERDSIKKIAQDYSRRKSINLTNVKIDRTDAKPWLLALSNFSASYSYSEEFSRNIKTDHRINREIMGALTYNYNTNSKPIVPLKKVKFLNSKYLRLIKDFNFNPIPSQFSFRTNLTRSYYEQQLRNISNPEVIFQPTYSKDFLWNRIYTLNWDLAQSLKFDFTANNIARIDEPDGIVDRKYRDSYDHWRDSVVHNILNFGRTTQYNHQFNLTYSLPLNKIPFIDWTALTTKYTGNYRWEAGPVLSDTSNFDPGNKIQNSNTVQVMGQLNLLGLYNKSGYLKQLNQKFDQMARGTPQKKKMNTVKYEEKGVKLKANLSKSIHHKLKTEIVTVKVYDEKGTEIKVKPDIKSDERISIKTDKDYENVRVVVEGKIPEKSNPLIIIAESTIRVLMGFKSVSLSLSDTRGTFMPGYKPTTKYLGLNDMNGISAPGFAFITGWQDPEFAWYAIRNGWLTKDTTFRESFNLTASENITFRTTFEPMPSLRVEFNALRTYSRNHSEYFHADENGLFSAYNPLTNGNFSISIISIGTAFKSPNKVFEGFRQSRLTVATRLANSRIKNSTNGYAWGTEVFPDGYSELSQNVLIPSFLSAYSNFSASNVTLDNFPKIPMPNWQITYDGLAKIQPFKNFLRTFSLTHGYRSIYTIGAFNTNLKYNGNDGLSEVRNTIDDFVPKREITNVSITEQFSPLIGIDMNWINSLTTRFEIKSGRSLAMSFSNNQLTEIDSWEYIIGGGYRFENLPIIFGPADGKQRTLKSDLRLRIDFSLRKNTTILHKMVEGVDVVNSGQVLTSIKTSADYIISKQVTLRAFFDWSKNAPLVTSASPPMVNTSFGFSLRFEMMP